eukprot:TRINITY_DN7908_c0_g1_i3.p1 TRINITY_DN7908_c0_g1~~TRINITY_DN7908_c0_g1_i3.p1  ORF type:complete len:130 (-),score=27.52 TRINITY_DN7908_c0_g1_i3:144-533(-)
MEEETDNIKLLKRCTTFSLGGVGYSGRISNTEKAFKSLLKRDDAKEIFTDILDDEESKSGGKLYVLLGIRWKFHDLYDERLPEFLSSSAMAEVTHGCMHLTQPMSKLAADIKDGKYDFYQEKEAVVIDR